jgi:predicted transcriptional regulator
MLDRSRSRLRHSFLKITVEVSPETKKKLDAYTEKTGIKLRAFIERAVDEFLQKHQA